MFSRSIGALLALTAGTIAGTLEERQATATLTFFPPLSGTPTIASACASVSVLASSQVAQAPKGVPTVPASMALACLQSVPVDVENDAALIDYLLPFVSYHSTLGYLKNPPKGYLYPGIDIIGGMEEIRQKVRTNGYTNQYEFTQDLQIMISSANDGHFHYDPALNRIFDFLTNLTLSSVSIDGIELPKVYVRSDLNGSSPISDISTINSIDVQTLINNLAYFFPREQDPDAAFNAMMATTPNIIIEAGFLTSLPSLSDFYNVTFSNGTSKTFPNYAVVLQSFEGINNGEDLHAKYELPPSSENQSSRRATSVDAAVLSARQTSASPPKGYPSDPIEIHSDGYVFGYFLSGNHSDTCVLVQTSFAASAKFTNGSVADITEARRVYQSFFQDCLNDHRNKLIIDLSGNPGGNFLEGIELYRNLFSNSTNWGGTRFRAHATLNFTGALAYNSPVENEFMLPVVDGNGKRYPTWNALYGPALESEDAETNIMNWDFSNPALVSENSSEPFFITGYGSASPTNPQPFEMGNIIVLTDGVCSSTCTTFVSLITREAHVRTIAVGGRPLNAPMQAMGGVKGGQSDDFSFLQGISQRIKMMNATIPAELVAVFPSAEDPPLQPIDLAMASGYNWRNAYPQNGQDGPPSQFLYEAANCRRFYQASHLFDIETMWEDMADVAWNGAQCVPGSTTNQDGTIGTTPPVYSDKVLAQLQPYTGPGSVSPAWTSLLTNTTGTDAPFGPNGTSTGTSPTTGTSSPLPNQSNSAASTFGALSARMSLVVLAVSLLI